MELFFFPITCHKRVAKHLAATIQRCYDLLKLADRERVVFPYRGEVCFSLSAQFNAKDFLKPWNKRRMALSSPMQTARSNM